MKATDRDLTQHNAKVTVLNFLDSLNQEDFDAARQQLTDNMNFKGVMGKETVPIIILKT